MMIRIPTHSPPTHPGEMLLEEFWRPMGISPRTLAQAIEVPYWKINELVNEQRGLTPLFGVMPGQIFWHVRGFLDKYPIIYVGIYIMPNRLMRRF